MDKISTSITIIAGDFNAKIGKRNGSENCIVQRSRGRKNESGSKVAEFCEMNDKVIKTVTSNTLQKQIATWFQKIINPTTTSHAKQRCSRPPR